METGAEEAIASLNGALFQGRSLTVNEARPREERPARGNERPRGSFNRRY
jgi:RNA recognition motif-containing protein